MSCVNPLHPEPLSLACATLGTNVFCQGKGGLNMWTEGKQGRMGYWGMARGIGRAGVCGQEGRSVDGWTGGRVGGNI